MISLKNAIKICALLLAAALVFCGCEQPGDTSSAVSDPVTGEPEDLSVYCFKAGAADAFLLYCKAGTVLIDCGEKGFGKTVLNYLEKQGIDRIDCLIITHFDKDHVGGAAKIINNTEIGEVLQSNAPKDSGEYGNYQEALGKAGIAAKTLTEKYYFSLGGVRFEVDPPKQSAYKSDESNNSSLIVSVFNGDDALLFCGDAETERITEFFGADTRKYGFIKIPHHGREEKLMEKLISTVCPKYAVITSSDEEPEAESVMNALRNANVEVFLTRVAPVLIKSDGKQMTARYAE